MYMVCPSSTISVEGSPVGLRPRVHVWLWLPVEVWGWLTINMRSWLLSVDTHNP